MTSIIIIAIVVVIAFWVVSLYNNFIGLGERVENAKAQIATQLESRWDAIKSLIDATTKYSQHEAEVLEKITNSRGSIGRSSSVAEMEKDAEMLDSVIGRLIAVSESYPDLKASQVYQTTMESIDKYENNVRQARMIYNDVVTKFNRKLKVVPSNIVGKIFGFSSKEYFQASESKTDMPSWD